MLRWALGALAGADLRVEGGALQKVVLARRARFLFEEAVDPFALLRRLEAATPRCFHALVEAAGPEGGAGGAAFLTATPERLFRLDGRALQTEAVAGTRPRAASDAADDRLRDELLGSEKDRREHGFVRDRIAAALAPLTVALDVDGDASAMTLARGRHLYTGVRGTLAGGVGALDVLRALHPTPAVGGTPTDLALDAIDRLEPFDRGLYAGPVGWVGRDGAGREAAEVAVGIRSGLVEGRTLSLYSGAGIVVGSDPAAEWAEDRAQDRRLRPRARAHRPRRGVGHRPAPPARAGRHGPAAPPEPDTASRVPTTDSNPRARGRSRIHASAPRLRPQHQPPVGGAPGRGVGPPGDDVLRRVPRLAEHAARRRRRAEPARRGARALGRAGGGVRRARVGAGDGPPRRRRHDERDGRRQPAPGRRRGGRRRRPTPAPDRRPSAGSPRDRRQPDGPPASHFPGRRAVVFGLAGSDNRRTGAVGALDGGPRGAPGDRPARAGPPEPPVPRAAGRGGRRDGRGLVPRGSEPVELWHPVLHL